MIDRSSEALPVRSATWRITASTDASPKSKSLGASLAFFGLGLSQAIALPVIGYVTLLEINLMGALPFIILSIRRFRFPPSVLGVVYLLITYGVLGLAIDIVAEAEPLEAARQLASTYLMIACLLCITLLCQRRPQHFRWFVAGYALWPVLKLVLGPEIAGGEERWFDQPWSYGLGSGLPILVLCLLPVTASRGWRVAAAVSLFVMVAIGLLLDARSTALLTLMVAVVLLAPRPVSERGLSLTPARWTAAAVMLVLAGGAGLWTYATLANSGALGPDVQRGYRAQFENPYGAAVAIRPDFVVALEAVARRPLFGYGSTQDDAAEFSARRAQLVLQRGVTERDLVQIDRGKIPSHSILLNAWIQVGILGGLLWLYLLFLTFATLPAAATSTAPFALICLYLCLVNAWTIPFSPGPPRIDVALGLAVMFVLREQLKRYARTAARPNR